MENIDTAYSDYIVYVDESGDHSLDSINPRYPLFVLAFCMFQKGHYAQKELAADPAHVYHLAMQLGLEKLYQFLKERDQHNGLTHVIFEARGRHEDLDLELEFRRICSGHNLFQQRLPFEIFIADKKTNSAGLQLADIAARPIGLSVLRPNQPNRAFAVLERKIYQDDQGQCEPFVFPIKAKGPKVALEAQTPVG